MARKRKLQVKSQVLQLSRGLFQTTTVNEVDAECEEEERRC